MSDDTTLLKATEFSITDATRRITIKDAKSDRIKTLGKIQTMMEFTRSMWQALQLYRPGLVFEPAYPSYVLDIADANIMRGDRPAPEIPDEIITWNLIRRSPGSLSGEPFGNTREVLPRVREEMIWDLSLYDSVEPESVSAPLTIGPNPSQPWARIYGTEVEGQVFDNLLQFDIWSKNNKTAEEMAEFLEDFMLTFRPMFLELGVIQMFFHSRIRDEFILNWKNGLVNRSLRYFIRTEKISSTPVREIKKINVTIEFYKFLNQLRNSDVSTFLTNYQNSIVRNWILQRGLNIKNS